MGINEMEKRLEKLETEQKELAKKQNEWFSKWRWIKRVFGGAVVVAVIGGILYLLYQHNQQLICDDFLKKVCTIGKLPESATTVDKFANDRATAQTTRHSAEVSKEEQEVSFEASAVANLANVIQFGIFVVLIVTAFVTLFSLSSFWFMFSYLQDMKTDIGKRYDEGYQTFKNEVEKFESHLSEEVSREVDNRISAGIKRRMEQLLEFESDRLESLLKVEMAKKAQGYEKLLALVEEVRADFTKRLPKANTVEELHNRLQKQLTDYLHLSQLAFSNDENDMFTALGYFRQEVDLPSSFLNLLRLLEKQGKLSGDNLTNAKEKFTI